jgi:hypothetical protein
VFGRPGGGHAIWDVAVGGPGLVAVGVEGWIDREVAAVWASVDGITWTRVPHDETVFGGAGDVIMSSVTVGGPGLVAVGGQGWWSEGDGEAAVWTSVDGITWRRVPHDEAVFGGTGSQRMNSVALGGPGLVAVGSVGSQVDDLVDAAVWTSVDGITWTRVPHDEAVFGGERIQTMESVTAGGPGLVAVGGDELTGSAAVWTSVDGITWFRVPHNETVFGTEGNPAPMLSVTAGGPGLVAVGADLWPPGLAKTPAWTSPDGITWTRVPDDVTFRGAMMDVTVGGPGLVTVGLNGIVWTSVDGITWTSFPDDDAVFGRGGHMFSVITQGPYLVAVGSDGSGTVPDRDAVVWVATLED